MTALAAATPVLTGKVASSWRYEIVDQNGNMTLTWLNDDIVDNVVIAVIIQYGHGTRGGTFVPGIDYINPAMKPIFQGIKKDLDKELKKL